MFRAIADQLDGDQSKFDEYRLEAVTQIRENKEYFKMFMDDEEEDIDEYIKEMSEDSVWGG